MNLKKAIQTLFGRHQFDGICYVPEKWVQSESKNARSRLIDLLSSNASIIEITKLNEPIDPKDLYMGGLERSLFELAGSNSELIRFKVNELPLDEHLIPSILSWLFVKFGEQVTFMPDENTLIRVELEKCPTR